MSAPDATMIERHSKAKRVALGQEIASRKKLYLDLCFWIFARDAMLGVLTDSNSMKLLHFLRRGVRKGIFICPISSAIFREVMKQPVRPERRIATASFIDELSLGVTIMPPHFVIGTEVHRWLLLRKGGKDTHPMQELIWTKVVNILGDLYPSWPDAEFTDKEEFTLQKNYFDYVWEQPLAKIIETFGDTEMPANDFTQLSAETNDQNKVWAHELKSFEKAYDIELRGVIETVAESTAKLIQQIVDQSDGWPMSDSAADQAAREKGAKNFLYDGFRKADAKDHLRSLHIGASIHAAMRRDKERQFKSNDYFDIQHSTVAMAYCDAFLTEKSFRVLLSKPQLGLEAINGCKVISDVGEAVGWLRANS